MSNAKSRQGLNMFFTVLLTVLAVVYVYPALMILLHSFQGGTAISTSPVFQPPPPHPPPPNTPPAPPGQHHPQPPDHVPPAPLPPRPRRHPPPPADRIPARLAESPAEPAQHGRGKRFGEERDYVVDGNDGGAVATRGGCAE